MIGFKRFFIRISWAARINSEEENPEAARKGKKKTKKLELYTKENLETDKILLIFIPPPSYQFQ